MKPALILRFRHSDHLMHSRLAFEDLVDLVALHLDSHASDASPDARIFEGGYRGGPPAH